jgi:hypothetical protein
LRQPARKRGRPPALRQAGDQQNITANRNLTNDAKVTTRPLFIGRDTARGPNIYQVDAR